MKGNELYCYNTEVDRNSVVSQASWRMDVPMRRQNPHMVKAVVFDAFYIVGSGLWTLWEISSKVYEYVTVRYVFKLLVGVVISDK